MKTTNNVFYLAKNDVVAANDSWEGGYEYRVVIAPSKEHITIEHHKGKKVSIPFSNTWELNQVLGKVQNEIITSLIGAPNA